MQYYNASTLYCVVCSPPYLACFKPVNLREDLQLTSPLRWQAMPLVKLSPLNVPRILKMKQHQVQSVCFYYKPARIVRVSPTAQVKSHLFLPPFCPSSQAVLKLWGFSEDTAPQRSAVALQRMSSEEGQTETFSVWHRRKTGGDPIQFFSRVNSQLCVKLPLPHLFHSQVQGHL